MRTNDRKKCGAIFEFISDMKASGAHMCVLIVLSSKASVHNLGERRKKVMGDGVDGLSVCRRHVFRTDGVDILAMY